MKTMKYIMALLVMVLLTGCTYGDFRSIEITGNHYDTFENYEAFELVKKEMSETATIYEQKISTTDFSSIRVEVVFESMDIIFEERNDIMIHYYSVVEDDTLPQVDIVESGDVVFDIEWPQIGCEVTGKIDVYVPIGTEVMMNMSNISGYIVANNVTAGDAYFSTVSGKIDIESVIGDDTHFDSISGGIEIGYLESMSTAIDTVSGWVLVKENNSKDLDVETVSGSIDITTSEQLGNMRFDTVSGAVHLAFGALDAVFTYDTLSGDVDVDQNLITSFNSNNDEDRLVVGDGTYHLDIETLSGSITVEVS